MDPQKEEKLEQLEKVLQSRALHSSENLRAFLKFVVLKTLDHKDSQLKEYTIATEVFGRGNSYDSRNDSVVRVQAGRLRAKLQEYYTTEGKHDKVLIDLPKGHYAPSFAYNEHNGKESANAAAAHAELTTVQAVSDDHSSLYKQRVRWLLSGLAVLCVGLTVLTIIFGIKSNQSQNGGAKAAIAPEVQATAPLWDNFLRSPEPVLVAFSNTKFQGTAETGMRLLNPITGAGTGDAKNDAPAVITEHYTGVGEVMGVYALGEFFYKGGRSIRVKRSLLLTWDDLKTTDIIILGSPAENNLLRDLPQQQDFIFRLTRDASGHSAFGVDNTKPAAGEQPTYHARQEGPSRSQVSEDYAVISFLRGLDENRRLLILAGITTFGTQAAAEYVTKPEHIKDLIAHLNTAPTGQPPKLPPYFQVLVKVKVNGGVPVQISYVTHHVL